VVNEGVGAGGEKWTKPCMHIWIIKEKGKTKTVLSKLNFTKVVSRYKLRS
jgi:hypothetical protein